MNGILIGLLAVVLAGCGGGSLIGSVPECTDETIKEAAIDWLRMSGEAQSFVHTHPRRRQNPEVWNDYYNQEFRLVLVRTLGAKKGDKPWDAARRCVAELHGRRMDAIYGQKGEGRQGWTLRDEVQRLEDLEYLIFLDDDGNAHIRSWTQVQ